MPTWADQFATHNDACHYYGIDRLEQMEAERAYQDALFDLHLRELEAALGPYVARPIDSDFLPF